MAIMRPIIDEDSQFSPAIIAVERAIFDLRSGLPVRLTNGTEVCLIATPEMLSDHVLTLAHQATGAHPALIITPAFARHLRHSVTTSATRLALPTAANAYTITHQVMQWIEQPSATEILPSRTTDGLAIELIKQAALLPFSLVWNLPTALPAFPVPLQSVAQADMECYLQHTRQEFHITSQSKLPLKDAEDASISVFRSPFTRVEHLMIRVGTPDATPLVRIHSSCVTGDILGSLRCDCGEQLHEAIHRIAERGGGVLLYLNQEGRGIGIANKIRAYALQDKGHDTVDANIMLGFDPDERNFTVAAAMLRKIGYSRVTLLTNNPRKVEGLTRNGIEVAGREPLTLPSNAHNQSYMDTKTKRLGHLG